MFNQIIFQPFIQSFYLLLSVFHFHHDGLLKHYHHSSYMGPLTMAGWPKEHPPTPHRLSKASSRPLPFLIWLFSPAFTHTTLSWSTEPLWWWLKVIPIAVPVEFHHPLDQESHLWEDSNGKRDLWRFSYSWRISKGCTVVWGWWDYPKISRWGRSFL